MEFKEKVLKARLELGLSQVAFSKLLGVGYATINRWENGSTKPNKIKEYQFEKFCKDNKILFEVDE